MNQKNSFFIFIALLLVSVLASCTKEYKAMNKAIAER